MYSRRIFFPFQNSLSLSTSIILALFPSLCVFILVPFSMDLRINDDYAQLNGEPFIYHTENNYTRRELKVENENGKATHCQWCDMFCIFIGSDRTQPKEYFHNNYCMANNRWGILLSALNRVAYRLHHFIHSFHLFSSTFLFFRFTCLVFSCHSIAAYKSLSFGLKLFFFMSWQDAFT